MTMTVTEDVTISADVVASIPTGYLGSNNASDYEVTFTVPAGITVLKLENSNNEVYVGVTSGKTYTVRKGIFSQFPVQLGIWNPNTGIYYSKTGAPDMNIGQQILASIKLYFSYSPTINQHATTINDY